MPGNVVANSPSSQAENNAAASAAVPSPASCQPWRSRPAWAAESGGWVARSQAWVIGSVASGWNCRPRWGPTA